MRIFITGATGFLGYHIACECLKAGHTILCLRRKTSVSLFSQEQEKYIEWVTLGTPFMKKTIETFQPEILIHSAWQGVSANDRNNELIQHSNLQFFMDVINLYNYNQIIALGSQEEYGCLNEIIDENVPLNPQSEYAKDKVSCSEVLRNFSKVHGYEWQWLRVFNIYGEKQNTTWLIPAIITECLNNREKIPVTEGRQQYAYLYCDDFAKAIVSVIWKKVNPVSIIYHLPIHYH
ncbi:MAG: NAD-dependent epimerase/dehydratase family protein [Bacteroides sp.]|nr:NAD-dependent epimerase/dehydratase family protein [Tannerellaceae bacterium]MCD8181737.1 NAD-dependent epimerase/dehydratase family protein [Bacteroides sp.]